MKRELKGFACGVIAAALAAGGVSFAAGQWKTIDVLENDITVMVDGKQVTEDNFVYNDRTYLPLRAVADAVGKPVDYDEATNTAYIGTKPDEVEYNITLDFLGRDDIGISQYDITDNESTTRYVSFSDINRLTASTGVYTSITHKRDGNGAWTFSEWNNDTSGFEEKSTGTSIFLIDKQGNAQAYIPLNEYEELIKPILSKYVR